MGRKSCAQRQKRQGVGRGKVFNRTKSDGSVERVVPLRSANYTSEYVPESELKNRKNGPASPRTRLSPNGKRPSRPPQDPHQRALHDHRHEAPHLGPHGTNGGCGGSGWPTQNDRGKRNPSVGVEFSPENLNAEADAVKIDAAGVFETVMDHNKIVRLANEWKFRRPRPWERNALRLWARTPPSISPSGRWDCHRDDRLQDPYFLPVEPRSHLDPGKAAQESADLGCIRSCRE